MNNFSSSLLGTLTAIILCATILFWYNDPIKFRKNIGIPICCGLISGAIVFVIGTIIIFIYIGTKYVHTKINYVYNFVTSLWIIIKDLLFLELDCNNNVTINAYKFNRKFIFKKTEVD